METTKPRNTLKITINPDATTELVVGGWAINTNPNAIENEPERVDVEKNGLSYSIVFTTDGVKLEVWTVENGELSSLMSVTDIPKNG